MTYVILSYRRSYELRCSRSCNCYEGGNCGDFETCSVETVPEAARWIAGQIRVDPRAEYANLVFTRWEDFEAAANRQCTNTARAEKSIDVPGRYPDDDYEHYGELKCREEERNALCSDLRRRVADQLKAWEYEAKQKENEERRKKAAIEKSEQDKKDAIEFERLRLKFGGRE